MFTHALHKAIRKQRQSLGLTQLQVSALIGTSRRMITRIEKGDDVPSLRRIEQLAVALNTTPWELIERAYKEHN